MTTRTRGFSATSRLARFRTVVHQSTSLSEDEEQQDVFSVSRNEIEDGGPEQQSRKSRRSFSTIRTNQDGDQSKNIAKHDPLPVHEPIQSPAGLLCDDHDLCVIDDTTRVLPHMGRSRKRVLVLCTGGTLTMCHDPTQDNSLAPVQGALTAYLASMRELTDDPEMPEIVSHEYAPLIDSSDMGPADWGLYAEDIAKNYYHFDGEKHFRARWS